MSLSVLYLLALSIEAIVGNEYVFPPNFKFGVASSSYQVEGAWNADGKGENIWDKSLHDDPGRVSDQSNGDFATDSYHKYKEDVQLIKNIGVNFYRFSLSWPRLLPNGTTKQVNKAGVDYYNNLIKELLANGIEPYVTIYHWDLPQAIQDYGGWLNESSINLYVQYARFVFRTYGDRVKMWMSFNEPLQVCNLGYGEGISAPFVKRPGIGCYVCGRNLLLAHGRTWKMYNEEFRSSQKGKLGIVIDSYWHEPNIPSTPGDVEATNRVLEMNFGWFAGPVNLGNYPQVMIDRIANMSAREGFNESRLPPFTKDEQKLLEGSLDFIGLNYYTSDLSWLARDFAGDHPSHWADIGVEGRQLDDWWKGVPWGLRRLLNWIKNNFKNPPVLITENGFADEGELMDKWRANYIRDHLNATLQAIVEDKLNVIGYTHWSLLDSFEWTEGYRVKMGLHHVDFNDPNRKRTRKWSSYVYENIIRTRRVDYNYNPPWPPLANNTTIH